MAEPDALPSSALPSSALPSSALLAAIDAAFCLVEVIGDGDRVVDYRFIEVNPAFERMVALGGTAGRLASELMPDVDLGWYEPYARVAITGERVSMERQAQRSGRWFDVSAQRVGDPARQLIGVLFSDITARRADSQALRDSRERLELALSAGGGVATWDWDLAADRVTGDARFARLYEVDPVSIAAGMSADAFFAHVHADDLPRVRSAIAQVAQGNDDLMQEHRLERADGCIRWVGVQGRAQRGDDGGLLRLSGISYDLSVRKRAESRQAALLALGDRLRDLTDPAEIAYAGAQVLGETMGVSRAGYGIIDKASETITIDRDWNAPGVASLAGALRFRDFGSYIDDLKAGVTVAIADARRDPRTSATAAGLEAIHARAFVNMPLIEQGGVVALLYASNGRVRQWDEAELALMREVAERVRDATERARAQASSRAARDQILTFAQAMPVQIWAATATGDLYFANQRALDYSGAAAGSFDGPTAWGRDVHPDDLPAAGAAWARALATSDEYEVEFRLRGADGAFRWFLVRAVPVRDTGGVVTGWVGTNTDIDDQRRQAVELAQLAHTLEAQVETRTAELMIAEEALRQSQKMEAVGQLTGGIAHDFNNLLTGISGSLEMLGVRIAQGRIGEIERYAHAAQGAARRAAALTHRLLAFSRRQTLDPRPTDANRLVAGMEDLIRRTVGPAITVEVVAAGGLWPTLVDPPQLENAVLNLAINARDAMPDGGRLTIETANRWLDERAARDRDLPPGQYVSLCVSDTGTGMPADVIAKAFDPFFTTKPLGEGTGLGLSMIYGFARQSGGQVRIYSEIGAGSMLCLYLPRHHGTADGGEQADQTAAVPRAGAGETVLVVDDEPTVRMLVTEILEELGYAAIEAADGSAGLAILRSDARIDLLVSDVGLPGGMNGRQMADAARLVRPDLKILFITGYAENAVVGNGHLEPGMHVMTKPFAMDALALRIRDLIAGDR